MAGTGAGGTGAHRPQPDDPEKIIKDLTQTLRDLHNWLKAQSRNRSASAKKGEPGTASPLPSPKRNPVDEFQSVFGRLFARLGFNIPGLQREPPKEEKEAKLKFDKEREQYELLKSMAATAKAIFEDAQKVLKSATEKYREHPTTEGLAQKMAAEALVPSTKKKYEEAKKKEEEQRKATIGAGQHLKQVQSRLKEEVGTFEPKQAAASAKGMAAWLRQMGLGGKGGLFGGLASELDKKAGALNFEAAKAAAGGTAGKGGLGGLLGGLGGAGGGVPGKVGFGGLGVGGTATAAAALGNLKDMGAHGFNALFGMENGKPLSGGKQLGALVDTAASGAKAVTGTIGAAVGTAMGGPMGGAVGKFLGEIAVDLNPLVMFAQGMAKAVGFLQEFGDALHNTNKQFAEWSGAMQAVMVRQEVREIMRSQQRGERLAPTAEMLESGRNQLQETMAPIDDALTAIKNVIIGDLSRAAAVILEPVAEACRKFLATTGEGDKSGFSIFSDEAAKAALGDYAKREWDADHGKRPRTGF